MDLGSSPDFQTSLAPARPRQQCPRAVVAWGISPFHAAADKVAGGDERLGRKRAGQAVTGPRTRQAMGQGCECSDSAVAPGDETLPGRGRAETPHFRPPAPSPESTRNAPALGSVTYPSTRKSGAGKGEGLGPGRKWERFGAFVAPNHHWPQLT